MNETQEDKPEKDQQAAAPATDTAPEGTAASEPAPELPPATPEERIAALEAEKAELRDRMLRIAADFENWKKRSRKELTDSETRAKEMVLREFLEVIDNLERATASWAQGTEQGKEIDPKAIRDGVDLVLRQFRSKLERHQVKPLDAKGAAFDPRFHEAISQVPATADVKPGAVVHELQKGYMIGDRLLRPAMVVVAAALPTPPAPAEKPAEEAAPEKKSDHPKDEK